MIVRRQNQEEEESFLLRYEPLHIPPSIFSSLTVRRKQELNNLIRDGRYVEALKIAISLSHPSASLSVIRSLLGENPLALFVPFDTDAKAQLEAKEAAMDTDGDEKKTNPFPAFLKGLSQDDLEKVRESRTIHTLFLFQYSLPSRARQILTSPVAPLLDQRLECACEHVDGSPARALSNCLHIYARSPDKAPNVQIGTAHFPPSISCLGSTSTALASDYSLHGAT